MRSSFYKRDYLIIKYYLKLGYLSVLLFYLR
nr:MAG TPA: hypothetical protein [Caudoviricetes sp.]